MCEVLVLVPSIALKIGVVVLVIAEHRSEKQGHQNFKLILGYLTILRLVWDTRDLSPKMKTQSMIFL